MITLYTLPDSKTVLQSRLANPTMEDMKFISAISKAALALSYWKKKNLVKIEKLKKNQPVSSFLTIKLLKMSTSGRLQRR